MRLSNKTEYAIRALVHLAEHPQGEPCSLTGIAREQGIPLVFLEKIFSELKKAEMVTAQRGVRGGYLLAKPLEAIAVKDIIEAVEGPLIIFERGVRKEGAPKLHCKSHLVMALVQEKFIESLRQVRLCDLIHNN